MKIVTPCSNEASNLNYEYIEYNSKNVLIPERLRDKEYDLQTHAKEINRLFKFIATENVKQNQPKKLKNSM